MSNFGDKWGSWDTFGRVCRACNQYKSWDNFHRHSSLPNGYNSVCKTCRKPKSQENWKTKDYVCKIFDRAKSRARLKDREFSISLEDIIISETCPVFGVPMKEGTPYAPSIDRKDSNKGYTKDNIQIISTRANILKNNATPKELKLLIKFLEEGVCEI